jgi:hypothetical protein
MDGICTLANDHVYHQLVALLNSIEAIQGADMPVCVYPYDDNTTRIAAEIACRPNVQLYSDRASMEQWDEFARQIWDAHPTARQRWGNSKPDSYYRMGTHRRLCAFDGPFDRFLYMDADTLLMSPVECIFEQLEKTDWVVYDFQHKDPDHVYDLSSTHLSNVFSPERIQAEIFCSGFYASKRDLFGQKQRDWLLNNLRAGDAEVLYPMAPDQTILNYMVMKSDISSCNFALSLPPQRVTGCCVTSPGFLAQNHILYDKGNRLTYIHYIGIKSHFFNRLCEGENIDFPYRNLFLHYRYLQASKDYPAFTGKPRLYNAPPDWQKRILRKIYTFGEAHQIPFF